MDDVRGDIDSDRLALIVQDSIERQVAKFDDPVTAAALREHFAEHVEAGHVTVVSPEGSDFVNVIVGETWLARIHWRRVAKRSDPRLN